MRETIGIAQRIAGGRSGDAGSGAVLEAPALVAGLDDVAVVREAIEQRGGHLRIAASNLNDPFGTHNGAGLDVIRSATYRASLERHWRHVAETGEPRFDEFTLTFAACRLVYWRMALPVGEDRITPNMILIGSYFADPIQQKHFLDTFDRATGRASAPS